MVNILQRGVTCEILLHVFAVFPRRRRTLGVRQTAAQACHLIVVRLSEGLQTGFAAHCATPTCLAADRLKDHSKMHSSSLDVRMCQGHTQASLPLCNEFDDAVCCFDWRMWCTTMQLPVCFSVIQTRSVMIPGVCVCVSRLCGCFKSLSTHPTR